MKSLIAMCLAMALVACGGDGGDDDCPDGFVPSEQADAHDIARGVVYGECAPLAVKSSEEALTLKPFPTMVEPFILGLRDGWTSPTSHWLNKSLQGETYARYQSNGHKTYLNLQSAYKCQLAVNAASCFGKTYVCPHLIFGNIKAYQLPGQPAQWGVPSGFQVTPSAPVPASLIQKETNRLVCSYTMSGFPSYKLTRISQVTK
jgi:hypothetical protein